MIMTNEIKTNEKTFSLNNSIFLDKYYKLK